MVNIVENNKSRTFFLVNNLLRVTVFDQKENNNESYIANYVTYAMRLLVSILLLYCVEIS